MKLQFRGNKILVGQAVRGKAELRLGLLLGRFGDEVGKVTLRLSDADGPDGHSGKRCEIAIGLKPKGVRVEHTDLDMFVAFERAADKAVRSIARVLRQELEKNPARAAAILRLETARVLAADRVLGTAQALNALRTPKADRVLETARVLAAERVLATARNPRTMKNPRTLETARVLAANRVLDTARALVRDEKALKLRKAVR